MPRTLVLVLVVALATAIGRPLGAQQVLTLRNGDRFTGALEKAAGTTWVFRHAGGPLTIPTSEIAEYASEDALGWRLADGTILAAAATVTDGRLTLTAADGTAITGDVGDVQAVGSADDLEALQPVTAYFSPFLRYWSAAASLGFSDKSGNSRSTGIAAAVEVERSTPKDRITLKLGLVRERSAVADAPLETTVEKYYGSLRTDLFVGSRLFLFGATAQERDTFQDIDLRSAYTGGFGWQVVASDAADFRVYTSGGVRREAFTSGGSTSTPILASGAAARYALGPAVLAWTGDWAPSVKDIEDYRFVSDASLTTTVVAGLGFRVALRNEINNNPPAGVKKHDMLLTTTLTYTVGR